MKKRILSVLIAVLMIVLMLPVQAFAAPKEIKGAYEDQAFEMVIDNVVGAKTYSKSGSIPDGMSLSGSWAYKSKFGNYVFKMTLEGTPTKAGTYNFSVTYKQEDGKTVVSKVDYTITVGEEAPFDYIDSIYLLHWPTKTEYYLGDTVDLTGMKVTAVAYNYDEDSEMYEPSEIDVTDLAWVEPAVFTSDEAQTVEVFVKAPGNPRGTLVVRQDSFRVTFKYADPNDVLRIEVYQKPSKLTYTVGETLDTTGMTVRLHKGDGSAEDITEGFKTDVTTLDTVGTQTVTVSHGEGDDVNTVTFDVTVTEKVEEPASSSSSSSVPETPSEPESQPEVPSEPESESEPEVPSESEPEVPSEPESESEPEVPSESEPEVDVIGGEVEEPEDDDDNKGGIPFWVWIIIALLVILVAAAVALFLIGRRRLDEE